MAKNSSIVKVWVKKDDYQYKLFSYGNDFAMLQIHIKNFPIIQNEISESHRNLADTNYYHFRIALYYSDEIETFNVQHPDVDFFQGQIGDVNRDGSEDGAEFSPIIHILQKDADIFLSEKYAQNHRDVPRFRFIVDSGIWNYLATSKDDFRNDVADIVTNWSAGYYDLFIAREFADLNARLTKASYLYEPKDYQGGGSGHGADVSPFLFHSETQIKGRINAVDVSKYNWRFLLLDDKIDETKETGKLSSCDSELALTKAEILKNRINQIGIGSCEYILAKNVNYELPSIKDCKIQVICVETIPEALNLMRKYEFDVILLDYLLKDDYGYRLLTRLKNEITEKSSKKKLSKNNVEEKLYTLSGNTLIINDFDICGINDDAFSSIETNPKVKCIDLRETHIRGISVNRQNGPFKYIGDNILIYLPTGNSVSYNNHNIVVEDELLKGPHRKFFFMFISAFTTAVNERLTLESLSREEDYWLIGEGACPTNTPELFKYRLIHLMERRLNQTGVIDLSEEKILNTVKIIFSMPAEEENKERTERIQYIRKRAYENYRIILGLHYDYFILKDEDQGRSCLVDSFLKDKVHMGAMLEHLLQLVHLTAFGTVRQWPEIWEEYQFFTRTFSVKNENKKDLYNITKDIEKYIIDLKSNE